MLKLNDEVQFEMQKSEDGTLAVKNIMGKDGLPYIDCSPGPIYNFLHQQKTARNLKRNQ
eukprot:UN29833